jgi:hypothetical protein
MGVVFDQTYDALASEEAGVPLECDECGIEDGARWDRADGSAVCDGCIGG